jgi:hypothetical protein
MTEGFEYVAMARAPLREPDLINRMREGATDAGGDVLISARHEDQLLEVAARVEAVGRWVAVVPADLMDLAAVAALADTAVSELGRRRHRVVPHRGGYGGRRPLRGRRNGE